jgi:hypothetical protein
MIQSLGCINVTRARAAAGKSLQSLSGGRNGIWGSPEEVSGQKLKSWKLQDYGELCQNTSALGVPGLIIFPLVQAVSARGY